MVGTGYVMPGGCDIFFFLFVSEFIIHYDEAGRGTPRKFSASDRDTVRYSAAAAFFLSLSGTVRCPRRVVNPSPDSDPILYYVIPNRIVRYRIQAYFIDLLFTLLPIVPSKKKKKKIVVKCTLAGV